MILNTSTSYLIVAGLLICIILTYGNSSDMAASQLSGEKGSPDNIILDDSVINNNTNSNKIKITANSLDQEDILYLDEFEDIENDTLYRENFDNPIKITPFGPALNDPNLRIETVYKGINFPTSMDFLGNDDILVLEKNTGKVRRIIDGTMLERPLLDLNVGNKHERGLLGIVIVKQVYENLTVPKYVFLYYTATLKDGEDLDGKLVQGNRLYRYEFENNNLVNPKLLLDLPGEPRGDHQGGVVLVGPDNNIYLSVGDVNHSTRAQNNISGAEVDETGGILRITQDGDAVQDRNVLGTEGNQSYYYAYGIRNSFGIDFDPVTKHLWDTENGVICCDEINLVEPGFNSGWKIVQGISGVNQTDDRFQTGIFNESSRNKMLFDFNGRGKYSSPEFIWNNAVGPTALKFFNSDKLGEQYENDMFVGNVNTGSLYRFELNQNRSKLQLVGNLSDGISQTGNDLNDIQFALNMGRITDIDIGPDGNLYVLSHNWNANQSEGSIFRISKGVNLGENFTHEDVGWVSYVDLLSISTETSAPISGNGSLRVDVQPARSITEAVNSSWSVVSTDFIPVKEGQFYNYGLEVSAKDVNQLHSKVIYYDLNKNEINSDFIFGGLDGTFQDKFSNSNLSPNGTKYAQIQLWIRPTFEKSAYYIIDNVELAVHR